MATRDVPAGYNAAYGRSSDQRGYEISSWIGGEYLGDVPVLSGEATVTEDGMAVSMTVESTPATRVFTPEYAAPEQLRGDLGPVPRTPG